MKPFCPSLALPDLATAYQEGRLSAAELIEELYPRCSAAEAVWITLTPRKRLLEIAQGLAGRDPKTLPLYGVPFAIKDNIDLAGVATTAACPEFAYTPRESAYVVDRLVAAGALPMGKANLDQFATGLVGTRSPYGIARNAYDPDFIAGGSSSGSALAVARGMVSFALGTDTAGSGRIPAAFNNLVGLKPTLGRLSPRGMVPACRTLDTVSVLSLSAQDAARVCRVAEGYDAAAPYSRRPGIAPPMPRPPQPFRFGVPYDSQLLFFGNSAYQALFQGAIDTLEHLGGERVPIDYAPFVAAGELLYGGPWVAERYIVAEPLLSRRPEALHPITRQIIEGGAKPSAVDAWRAQYELQRLRRESEATWERVDVLLTPTAPSHFRIEEVEADPIRLNCRLGYYTHSVNLLDLAAVALPAGFTATGLPFGVSLVGPAWSEYALLELAARLHHFRSTGSRAAEQEASFWSVAQQPPYGSQGDSQQITVAVCGAHLSDMPLNYQLTDRGALLLERTRTAPTYRLLALPGGAPQRPGLQRVSHGGAAIDVEVWRLPSASFGSFVAAIPAPLAMGKVLLADGRQVCGFVCEDGGLLGAQDISAFGGWKAYLAARG